MFIGVFQLIIPNIEVLTFAVKPNLKFANAFIPQTCVLRFNGHQKTKLFMTKSKRILVLPINNHPKLKQMHPKPNKNHTKPNDHESWSIAFNAELKSSKPTQNHPQHFI